MLSFCDKLGQLLSKVEEPCVVVVVQDWAMFMVNLVSFAWTAAPAALVNSGLKYMQMIISLSFQQRLTENLHKLYLSNKVYYVASTLQGLSNADQVAIFLRPGTNFENKSLGNY
jgi:ABC-type uncharacterized transport system fused permease/ATPase subunit